MVTAEAAEVDTNQLVMDPPKLFKLGFRCLTYILEVNRDIRTSQQYFKSSVTL